MDIVTLFCEIDDFCTHLEPWLNTHQLPARQRERASRMHLSEVMTILVWFHLVGYRNFKQFYQHEVGKRLRQEFPQLVSYNRFVELQRDALVPLCIYLKVSLWGLHRHQLYRLDCLSGLPQSAHPQPSRFRREGRPRQKQRGLVLWFQTALGRQ